MSTAPARVRLLLVDDHAVVREGFHRLLMHEATFEVVAEAASGQQALALLVQARPDVLVMDVSLRDMSGIEATRQALALDPRVRVIMFSMHEDGIFASRSLNAGASGYVTKASGATELVRAIREVAAGRTYLSHDIAQKLALGNAHSATGQPLELSARELDLVKLLAEGRSVKEIAHMLGVSVKTIANQQTMLRQKLGASTPIKLLEAARSLGLVFSS